jgi:hypothetical protein
MASQTPPKTVGYTGGDTIRGSGQKAANTSGIGCVIWQGEKERQREVRNVGAKQLSSSLFGVGLQLAVGGGHGCGLT